MHAILYCKHAKLDYAIRSGPRAIDTRSLLLPARHSFSNLVPTILALSSKYLEWPCRLTIRCLIRQTGGQGPPRLPLCKPDPASHIACLACIADAVRHHSPISCTGATLILSLEFLTIENTRRRGGERPGARSVTPTRVLLSWLTCRS